MYVTGLGPVDPPPPTGQPAADGASHRVTSPIDCAVGPEQQPVELLTAALAPGRVGVYELTLRLPDRFPAFTSVVTLNCRIHDGGTAFRILQATVRAGRIMKTFPMVRTIREASRGVGTRQAKVPAPRRTAILLVLALPLAAQFQHLATTADGSVLYFSISLPFRDIGAPHQGRIYRWDAARGIHVFAERTNEGGPTLSNHYDLSGPSVTASGDSVAFTGRRDCRIGTPCAVNPQTEGVVQPVAGGPFLFQDRGVIHLSRNGRYALMSGFLFGDVTWVDLATGQKRTTPRGSSTFDLGSRIADDGSYLVPPITGGLVLWTQDSERTLPTSARPFAAVFSANGATAVYESAAERGLPRRIYSIDIATGRETLLLIGDETVRGPATMSVSGDGRRVLLLASEAADRAEQWIVLIDAEGSRGSWHTYIEEGFRHAILSGDGRVIFAVSTNNRLFRIDAESGEASELIPRTPFVSALAGTPLAGSAVRLQGGGFTWSECRADGYPLPESLCGVAVEFLGRRMPIERITPSEILFQIPWDAAIPPPPAVHAVRGESDRSDGCAQIRIDPLRHTGIRSRPRYLSSPTGAGRCPPHGWSGGDPRYASDAGRNAEALLHWIGRRRSACSHGRACFGWRSTKSDQSDWLRDPRCAGGARGRCPVGHACAGTRGHLRVDPPAAE